MSQRGVMGAQRQNSKVAASCEDIVDSTTLVWRTAALGCPVGQSLTGPPQYLRTSRTERSASQKNLQCFIIRPPSAHPDPTRAHAESRPQAAPHRLLHARLG